MLCSIVAQEKWNKVKWYLKELAERIGTENAPKVVDYEFIQRERGCFNHLSITHDTMLPLIKGFHNT